MAEANITRLHDQFSCSVCLDLFNDPVTLLCGHSFCMVCINNCWDQEDQQGVYSCPQCRKTFSPRPAVCKNTVLAEVVETLKNTRLHDTRPAEFSVGPEDIECDFCTENKSKAIKSCLMCLASFCETHLQPHYKSPAFKKHKLVEASSRLQEQICSQHDKLLEVYCRTDQRCICMLCTMDEHKGHNTVSVTAERAEKQNQLSDFQGKVHQKLKARDSELKTLTAAVMYHKRSSWTTVVETEKVFNDLIKFIEEGCSEVTKLLQVQEDAVVNRAQNITKQLEDEILELKRRDAEMEKLSHIEDPIQYIQKFQTLLTPSGSADLPAVVVSSFFTFNDVKESVSQLKEKLETCYKEQFEKISCEVMKSRILPLQRKEFLQYSCRLTLDPNTANGRIQLSNSNRMATGRDGPSYGSDFTFGSKHNFYKGMHGHPETFDCLSQVLCSESVCKPSYWEVDWSGGNGVSIAVSYKDINRKGIGNECVFGRNEKSWSLLCSPSSYSFLHNNQETKIPIKSISSKIGVFVDNTAGSLCFYSVSDTMTLIHRVQTTFTQPLYPGFGLNAYSTVQLCN